MAPPYLPAMILTAAGMAILISAVDIHSKHHQDNAAAEEVTRHRFRRRLQPGTLTVPKGLPREGKKIDFTCLTRQMVIQRSSMWKALP